MEEKIKYWVIGDIHGEHQKLLDLFNVMTKNNFSLDNGDSLVVLGDMCDRGPDSYWVMEDLKCLDLQYPGQVIILRGNHDVMMIDAADHRSDMFWFNGGYKTEESYSKITKIYGKNGFGNSFHKSGHYDWIKKKPFFYETEDYFFCHAPIPKEVYRSLPIGFDPRCDEHTLTWSYIDGVPVEEWVDPNPILKEYGNDGKICVYGHIHGLEKIPYKNEYTTKHPIRIGNAILIDTGAGCWKDTVLTCYSTYDRMILQSDGNTWSLL